MTPERFHDAATLVPILVIGFLGQTVYFVFGPELYFSKKTYLVPIVTAASAIVSSGDHPGDGQDDGSGRRGLGELAGRRGDDGHGGHFLAAVGVDSASMRRICCGWRLAASRWPPWPGRLPSGTMVQQIVVAVVAAAAYPALLWICGDPTVREAAAYLAIRWSMFRTR